MSYISEKAHRWHAIPTPDRVRQLQVQAVSVQRHLWLDLVLGLQFEWSCCLPVVHGVNASSHLKVRAAGLHHCLSSLVTLRGARSGTSRPAIQACLSCSLPCMMQRW